MVKFVENAKECADPKVAQEVVTAETVKALVAGLLDGFFTVVCQGGDHKGLNRTKFDSLVSVIVEKDFLSFAGHSQR